MNARPLALAAAVAGGCVAVVLWDPTVPGGPTCPSKLLGLCCPGCGGLRMAYSLLHGRVGDALHYNALTLVMLPVLVWLAVRWSVGRPVVWRRWAALTAMSVLAAWFVVRNLPFEPLRGLWV